MVRFLFPAIGAGLMYLIAPTIWENVPVKPIGPQAQGAILVALAAMIGGLVGEKFGARGGSK